jgi:CheY-like chemotaxis protein
MQAHANAKHLLYVVDDEPLLVELAATVLQALGYEVQTFLDPGDALRAFTAAAPRPSVVITDYAMHTMNGMDLIRECRRLEPGQKIILISGTVDESIYRNAREKPDHFLAKPYLSNQLVELLASVLAA